MNEAYYWYAIFAALLVSYLFIFRYVKAKRRYFFYFVAGSVLGYGFDLISFTNGYYYYPDFYKVLLFSLPVSMTIAEGFAVAITIYLSEFLGNCIRHSSVSIRYLPR